MSKKQKKPRRHREKGQCSCGMRKRDYRVLMEHAKAKGHTVIKKPKSGGHKYDTESKTKPFEEWRTNK